MIRIFLISIFFPILAFAQKTEFETFRTPTAPGFFLIQVFPSGEVSPLPVRTIFVRNYPENEQKNYSKIEPFILELGSRIIEKSQWEKTGRKPAERVVFLGEKEGNFLHFEIRSPDDIFEDFSSFASENLRPVFAEDLRFDFGGNIYETFPKTIDFLDDRGATIVGKFQKNRRTRVEITGTFLGGEVSAWSEIDLTTPDFARGAIAQSLPEIWEQFWLQSQPKSKKWNLQILEFFYWILAAIGILIIFFGVWKGRKISLKKMPENLFPPLDFQNSKTPKSPENPPFEIEGSRDERNERDER